MDFTEFGDLSMDFGGTHSDFVKLYTEQYSRLLNTARGLMQDPQDADDIVQRTFLILLVKHRGKVPHENPIGWLITTLRNLIKNDQNRRFHFDLSLDSMPETTADPHDPYASNFMQLLPDGLSQQEKQLLYWFCEVGLSHTEIAQRLGCSENASRMRLHRARNHCAALLNKEKNF